MRGSVHDSRVCALGKGPLWHPEREQIFWFDTLGKRLLTREGDAEKSWEFSTITATAGWVNRDTLLIAAVAELFAFSLTTGHRAHVAALEPDTRPNAGRADPWGGFWIGTTGHEPQAGAIYRFHQGRLTRLFDGLTAANGICFSPDRAFAYFPAPTPRRRRLARRPPDHLRRPDRRTAQPRRGCRRRRGVFLERVMGRQSRRTIRFRRVIPRRRQFRRRQHLLPRLWRPRSAHAFLHQRNRGHALPYAFGWLPFRRRNYRNRTPRTPHPTVRPRCNAPPEHATTPNTGPAKSGPTTRVAWPMPA